MPRVSAPSAAWYWPGSNARSCADAAATQRKASSRRTKQRILTGDLSRFPRPESSANQCAGRDTNAWGADRRGTCRCADLRTRSDHQFLFAHDGPFDVALSPNGDAASTDDGAFYLRSRANLQICSCLNAADNKNVIVDDNFAGCHNVSLEGVAVAQMKVAIRPHAAQAQLHQTLSVPDGGTLISRLVRNASMYLRSSHALKRCTVAKRNAVFRRGAAVQMRLRAGIKAAVGVNPADDSSSFAQLGIAFDESRAQEAF